MIKAKLTTTFKQLREQEACTNGYNKLVRFIQNKPFTEKDKERESYIIYKHSEEINLLTILESNGLDDCLWSLRAVIHKDVDKIARYIAVDCAMQSLHNFESQFPEDKRPRNALEIAVKFIEEKATLEELESAWSA